MVCGMTIVFRSLRVNSHMVYISSMDRENSSKVLGPYCCAVLEILENHINQCLVSLRQHREHEN